MNKITKKKNRELNFQMDIFKKNHITLKFK